MLTFLALNVQLNSLRPLGGEGVVILLPMRYVCVYIKDDYGISAGEVKLKFEKANPEQKTNYNDAIWKRKAECMNTNDFHSTIHKIIKDAAEETLPQIKAKGNKPPISERMIELIEERYKAIVDADLEEMKRVTKEMKRWKSIEKNARIHEIIDKDLDLRDRWAGIRELKKSI